jgi:hypothetical protein
MKIGINPDPKSNQPAAKRYRHPRHLLHRQRKSFRMPCSEDLLRRRLPYCAQGVARLRPTKQKQGHFRPSFWIITYVATALASGSFPRGASAVAEILRHKQTVTRGCCVTVCLRTVTDPCLSGSRCKRSRSSGWQTGRYTGCSTGKLPQRPSSARRLRHMAPAAHLRSDQGLGEAPSI